ncbi:hypothetical protein [Helicobacter salomonis]|uniref:hypothetical protein n=1 Tax=Helicobacter salomonis TaxID=56878 RepID=UPI000CF159FF|nr:hypothetical protein [Helicobacter salomonis]
MLRFLLGLCILFLPLRALVVQLVDELDLGKRTGNFSAHVVLKNVPQAHLICKGRYNIQAQELFFHALSLQRIPSTKGTKPPKPTPLSGLKTSQALGTLKLNKIAKGTRIHFKESDPKEMAALLGVRYTDYIAYQPTREGLLVREIEGVGMNGAVLPNARPENLERIERRVPTQRPLSAKSSNSRPLSIRSSRTRNSTRSTHVKRSSTPKRTTRGARTSRTLRASALASRSTSLTTPTAKRTRSPSSARSSARKNRSTRSSTRGRGAIAQTTPSTLERGNEGIERPSAPPSYSPALRNQPPPSSNFSPPTSPPPNPPFMPLPIPENAWIPPSSYTPNSSSTPSTPTPSPPSSSTTESVGKKTITQDPILSNTPEPISENKTPTDTLLSAPSKTPQNPTESPKEVPQTTPQPPPAQEPKTQTLSSPEPSTTPPQETPLQGAGMGAYQEVACGSWTYDDAKLEAYRPTLIKSLDQASGQYLDLSACNFDSDASSGKSGKITLAYTQLPDKVENLGPTKTLHTFKISKANYSQKRCPKARTRQCLHIEPNTNQEWSSTYSTTTIKTTKTYQRPTQVGASAPTYYVRELTQTQADRNTSVQDDGLKLDPDFMQFVEVYEGQYLDDAIKNSEAYAEWKKRFVRPHQGTCAKYEIEELIKDKRVRPSIHNTRIVCVESGDYVLDTATP